MKIKNECVGCGFCCTRSNCAYGKWNAEKHQCEYLTADSKCSKYAEIVEAEKSSPYPMMGCGCSSTLFNDRRNKKIKQLMEAV